MWPRLLAARTRARPNAAPPSAARRPPACGRGGPQVACAGLVQVIGDRLHIADRRCPDTIRATGCLASPAASGQPGYQEHRGQWSVPRLPRQRRARAGGAPGCERRVGHMAHQDGAPAVPPRLGSSLILAIASATGCGVRGHLPAPPPCPKTHPRQGSSSPRQ